LGNDELYFSRSGAIRDITEKKIAQQKIADSQELIESINKNISEGIYRSYTKGGLIYVNDAFAQMFGYDSPEDILGLKSLNLYAHPSDRKGLTKDIKKDKFRSNRQILFKRKDGSTFWGENSYILTTDHEGHTVFDGAIRDISKNKKAAEELERLNSELIDRNKDLALKENELQSSNEELRSNSDSLSQTLDQLSERNFELDQLVYRTSHDLRAPLRSVLGLTNLMKLENVSTPFDYVNKIEERILKMDDFIKAMLDYSRVSRMGLKIENIDINLLVKDCLTDLEFLEGFNDLKIITNFSNGSFEVKSDRLRFKIIFGNIISNAYKYRNTKLTNSYLKISTAIKKDMFKLTFEDNGIGISKDYLDKVFDMFFRATEKSDGSGLGMYIVKQSIDKLHGNVDIESKEGKGTTITISIPV